MPSHKEKPWNRSDCIKPDCLISGSWGFLACEHSCPFEECEIPLNDKATKNYSGRALHSARVARVLPRKATLQFPFLRTR